MGKGQKLNPAGPLGARDAFSSLSYFYPKQRGGEGSRESPAPLQTDPGDVKPSIPPSERYPSLELIPWPGWGQKAACAPGNIWSPHGRCSNLGDPVTISILRVGTVLKKRGWGGGGSRARGGGELGVGGRLPESPSAPRSWGPVPAKTGVRMSSSWHRVDRHAVDAWGASASRPL